MSAVDHSLTFLSILRNHTCFFVDTLTSFRRSNDPNQYDTYLTTIKNNPIRPIKRIPVFPLTCRKNQGRYVGKNFFFFFV